MTFVIHVIPQTYLGLVLDLGYFNIEHSVEIESRSTLNLILSFHTDLLTKICPE